jgi:hypothetical protein
VLSPWGTGFAAQTNGTFKNRNPKIMEKMETEILNFEFIIPPMT